LEDLQARDGAALAPLGAELEDTAHLFQFELLKANGQMSVPVPAGAIDATFPAPGLPLTLSRTFASTIGGRYRLGRLGRGWVDNFDISASEDSTGQVTVQAGDSFRFFFRQTGGSYFGYPGDQGTLVKLNGAFQLREANGAVTAFRSDGLLDYLQDANGNRLTAGYTGTQLTRLTHSNGSFLTLAYNAQGRLSQVTEPNGDIATYEYDASGEHLVQVTTTAGVTEYTYTTDATGPRAHALASISFPDGMHRFFQYDSRGWLAEQEADGGAERMTYTYGANTVNATSADNKTTILFYDNMLRLSQVQDPLGRLTKMTYDLGNNLVSVSAVGGGDTGIGYDGLQNIASTRDPLGETQNFTYEAAHNQLASFTDSLSHTTDFSYDAQGNRTTATYADSSADQYGYDAQGNLTRSVNRLGQTITYTYNTRGQVTRKDLPGGAHVDYTYNSRGNLETAVDASGTTRLEYLDPQNPNLVTKISYPSGRFLQYTYQNGQRVRMVAQDGFTTNYLYDAAGRLEFLRDGSSNLIVQYHYDAVGRVDQETRGNGTATGYDYYDDGQIRTITNYAPDGSIQSQLTYTYDSLGRRTSVTTADGTTSYGYDGAGRLTTVSMPGRTIVYAYDSAGNRTTVTDNGVVTPYTVNSLNEYTSFGATSQTFDAAGNLVSSANPAGSTSYRYDAEGRLLSQITPQGTWTYEYDVFGNRISSTLNGVRTQYLVDPAGLGDVVAEYDGSGNLRAHYVHGLGLASRVDATNQSAFYQFDAIGNTTELTNDAGAVVNSYAYLPFGEALRATETVANPFQYVGQAGVMREGSGLDYMRNRWYEPRQGRFSQPDPIGLEGGTNLYGYVANAPALFVDPSGLAPLSPNVPISWSSRILRAINAGIEVPDALWDLWAKQARGELSASDRWFLNQLERRFLDLRNIAATAARRSASRAGSAEANPELALWTLIGLEALQIGVVAGQGLEAYQHGEIAPCLPTIPKSLQACEDPGDSIIEKLVEEGTLIGPVKTLLRAVKQVAPHDPNDLVGPGGFGPEQFIAPGGKLPYTIDFQNIPTALASAAQVVVTQPLDDDLDLDTFELGDFGFGDVRVTVPAGRQFYHTRLDLRSTRGVFVDVTANLDRTSRTVTWSLSALDPTTLDLPGDPAVGFLPPDRNAGEGEGFVTYFVSPKSGLPTGTRLDAQASIVFDANAPLATNVFTNTIDAVAPTSSVTALPAFSPGTFTVSWSGVDDPGGSGIAAYDVFVSDNGGPFTLWQNSTTATSATYTGVVGHTYGFYSVATDNVGNVQPTPTAAQVSTQVVAPPTADNQTVNVPRNASNFALTVSASDPNTNPTQTPLTFTVVQNVGHGMLTQSGNGPNFTYTPATNYAGPDAFTFQATNQAGLTSNLAMVTINVANVTAATVTSVSANWGLQSALLQTAGDGLRLLPAGRNTDLPWPNMNTLSITLSQAAPLNPGDVSVTGLLVANYGPVTISGSGTSYTITFNQAITAADRVTLTLGNPSITTFTGRLDVLPGDVNDDGVVNTTDGVLILRNFTPAHLYQQTYDLNGDGSVDRTDFNIYRPFIGTTLPPLPQLAAGGEGHGAAAPLTPQELAPILTAAVQRWIATGLPVPDVVRLESVTAEVADLPSRYLGGAALGAITIYLSRDAAGYGWFIDPTPLTNTAFSQVVTATQLQARGTSPAAGHEDLLTVVMHELGHSLGLDDLVPSQTASDLMTETLATGVRRLPSVQDVAALTPWVLTSQAVAVNASPSVNPSFPTARQGRPAPALIASLAPPSNSPLPVVALISLPASIATVPGGGGTPLPGTTPGIGTGTPTAALAPSTGPGWLIEPTSETAATFPPSEETELAANLARTLARRAGWTDEPSLDVGLSEIREERDPWPGVWGNDQA
jgi:RHS repeat-associated protein